MAGNTRDAGQTVASRLLAVLAVFDEQHSSLTLTELSAGSGLAVATTHRLPRGGIGRSLRETSAQ